MLHQPKIDILAQLDTNKGNMLHWPTMAGWTVSSCNTVLCAKLYQESASVLFNSRGMAKGTGTQITEGYKPMIIYNSNESGLFFWLPPTMTRWKEIQV
jgi:hypothetical protein